MLVQVTVRIEARVGNLSQTISGNAVEIEETTRRLGQRIEGVVVECGFDELRERSHAPCAVDVPWKAADVAASPFRV